MTAKQFLESKGMYTPELETILTEFHNLPCTCNNDHYGYGYAKCYDCGRLKPFENSFYNPETE
jgi:hypothetical protein